MKVIIAFVASLVVAVVPAASQPGLLGLFAEADATTCSVSDTGPGAIQIHVVQLFAHEALSSAFKVAIPACASGLTWIGDASDYFKGGFSPTGIAVGYLECRSSPILVLTINYWGTGLSSTCCPLTLEPDPRQPWGTVVMQDCADPPNTYEPATSQIILNSDATCLCDAVGTESLTWGRLKALYAP